MKTPYPLAAAALALISALAAAPPAAGDEALARALVLHASFDEGFDADFSKGDPACYLRQGGELAPCAASEELQIAEGQGRWGSALWFPKKGTARPMFRGEGMLGYHAENWSATVSCWLRLTPDEDLEPGYCDPVQIIGDDTKKGFIFLEWSKDETPRFFRYAIRPLIHLWDPEEKGWEGIPYDQRPMVQLAGAPFSRDRWTHAAFTLDQVNRGKGHASGALYLDGVKQGAIEGWDLRLEWDPAAVMLVLGAAYVGHIDDLAVFDRALDDEEVRRLHGLEGGVRDLLPVP